MLTLNTIKTTLPGDIEIGEAGSFTRLSLPNGDVLADVQLSTGRLFTSVDLLTASVDDVDTSADELDLLTDGYAEAFHRDFLGAWKEAGFSLDCVEDASGDPRFVMITARLEGVCSDADALASRLKYLRAHRDDASGVIEFV